MKRYRIEVLKMQVRVHLYETDDFWEARRVYRAYNDDPDCWTRLYVDGQTGNKAWMDRQFFGADPAQTWREMNGANVRRARRKRRKEHESTSE